MTYTQMISLIPEKDSPVEEAGRGFFAPQTSLEDRKKLLEFLLDDGRYEQLCKLMFCGHINGNIDTKSGSADYLAMTGKNPTLNTRYFGMFVQLAYDCGIREDKLIPLFFNASVSDKRSALRGWKKAADRYLTELAKSDYDKTWEYLRANDKDFRLVSILLSADKERALVDIIHLAVYGKGVNKVALRNFLRGYCSEVFAFVRAEYGGMKTGERIAAVRLLLLFKNEPSVATFLGEIAEKEKASSILRLLGSVRKAKHGLSDNPTSKQLEEYFYDAMIRGVTFSAERFQKVLVLPPFDTVVDSLFFSVYKDGYMTDIVIVDGGKVLNLENSPVTLSPDSEVKVLHAVELTAKYEYVKRLNITQPFEQIKRKVYLPSSMDRCSNCCSSIAGTIVNFGRFKVSMRKLGFRVLNRDRDRVCTQVGIARNGIVCVLDIAPIDFSSAGQDDPVLAYSVRFYGEKDVIRLGGQLFVEEVLPLNLSKIEPRVFSEFMYSVYELMGCQ